MYVCSPEEEPTRFISTKTAKTYQLDHNKCTIRVYGTFKS